MNAFGKYGGSSLSATLVPACSPRTAMVEPSSATIVMVGGRFGISSDWIGGRCAPTQTMTPTTASTAQMPATALQYTTRPIAWRTDAITPLRGLRLRAPPPALPVGFFFGLSSATFTRSCGVRRMSASDSPDPNFGSRLSPAFFLPHAIASSTPTVAGDASEPGLRPGKAKVKARFPI